MLLDVNPSTIKHSDVTGSIGGYFDVAGAYGWQTIKTPTTKPDPLGGRRLRRGTSESSHIGTPALHGVRPHRRVRPAFASSCPSPQTRISAMLSDDAASLEEKLVKPRQPALRSCGTSCRDSATTRPMPQIDTAAARGLAYLAKRHQFPNHAMTWPGIHSGNRNRGETISGT